MLQQFKMSNNYLDLLSSLWWAVTKYKANLLTLSNIHLCVPIFLCQILHKLFASPNLEYGSSVWDPFRQYQIDAVEMVQRRAARFVTGQYNRYQSVTSMLQELKWTTLQQRRQEQRLVNLYKCVNNINTLQIPPYVVKPTRTTKRTTQ